MACETLAGGVVVCSGPRGIVRRHILRCWNCKTNRRVVQVWQGMFYGSIFYCCHCGDGWGEGEALPRPFARGWREKATKDARQRWLDALTPAEFTKAIDAEIERYFE